VDYQSTNFVIPFTSLCLIFRIINNGNIWKGIEWALRAYGKQCQPQTTPFALSGASFFLDPDNPIALESFLSGNLIGAVKTVAPLDVLDSVNQSSESLSAVPATLSHGSPPTSIMAASHRCPQEEQIQYCLLVAPSSFLTQTGDLQHSLRKVFMPPPTLSDR